MPSTYTPWFPGRRFSPEERRRILTDFRTSGESRARFCAGAGLHHVTLTRWLDDEKRAASQVPTPRALVPVTIVPGGSSSSNRSPDLFEVHLPSGVEIRIPPKFDRVALVDLLAALESISC